MRFLLQPITLFPVKNKNQLKLQAGEKEIDQSNCNSLWNLSRSLEVDRTGFFAATFLPSSTASYTTLSAPALLKRQDSEANNSNGNMNLSLITARTSCDWGRKGIGRRAEMERDCFAVATTPYTSVGFHDFHNHFLKDCKTLLGDENKRLNFYFIFNCFGRSESWGS